MKKITLIPISVFLLFISGCVSTAYQPKTGFDRNESISTTSYKTFAWLKESKVLVTPENINPVMKARFDQAIEQAFIAKGYQLINNAEQADFTISYTLGSREKVKVDSFPHTYRVGWGWGRYYYPSFHVNHENRVKSYQEGKLAIDVFDVKEKTPAWHGWATQRIRTAESDNPGNAIKPLVEQLVSNF